MRCVAVCVTGDHKLRAAKSKSHGIDFHSGMEIEIAIDIETELN